MRAMMLMLMLGITACAETPKETAARLTAEDKTRAALDRELAGLVPGPPQSCVQAIDRREMKTFGETLVYRGGPGGVRYVVQAPGCRGVGDNSFLVTSTPTSQLCRGDIATAVDRTSKFQTGSCSFGDFIPYRKP